MTPTQPLPWPHFEPGSPTGPLYGPHHYARAEAAMSRLRYWDMCIKAILERIGGIGVHTHKQELFDKLVVAEADLRIVLEHIGPLPPETGKA